MARLERNRDQILFGHSSRCLLPRGDSRLEPRTSADVDFSDVFGGPPKTPSALDRHHGFIRSVDASISIGGSERFERKGEAAEHQWRWSTSIADSLERRGNLRGDEYASSADPSPVLILDHLRNSTANARRSGRAKNEPKNINQNPSRKIRQLNWANEIQNLYGEEDSGRLSYTGGNFHFSIYKWASTEISLVTPYNLKNKIKSSRRVSDIHSKTSSKVQGEDPDARSTKDGSKTVIDDIQKDRKGDEETGIQARERKSFLHKYAGKRKDADNAVNMGHETRENATHVSNNVREFIKIFNNGTTQKSNAKFESKLQKPRPRNEDKEQQKIAEMKDKMDNERLSTPTTVEQRPRKTVELVANKNVSSIKREAPTSEADASPVLPPGAGVASFHNIEAFNVILDGCLVGDVGDAENEVSEADLYRERIQASDAKIREWSRGKEGNIRSLLSTLQYVLWPESGWKPVPLVGIIEGAAMRRAYQKAMLCLHPDKLQQKRVEMHHKYVAQKVFDILQEAWTHFNSLSTL